MLLIDARCVDELCSCSSLEYGIEYMEVEAMRCPAQPRERDLARGESEQNRNNLDDQDGARPML